MNLTLHRTSLKELDEIMEVLVDSFGSEEGAALVYLLQRLVEDDALTLALMARVDDEPVGFIAFSPVDLEEQPAELRVEGLAPLGIKTEWQRRGIGSALIKEGLKVLRWMNTDAVVVLGSAAYYKRFGFEYALPLGITNEYGAKRDFRILALNEGSLSHLSGMARYAPAFQAL